MTLSGVAVSAEQLIRLQGEARGLFIEPGRRIASARAGAHLAPFRGRGIEFDEVRAYQPGDDVRTIDWRVTARTGQTYTKLFREERERPVLLLVDQSHSMAFGTQVAFKRVIAAEVATLLAWACQSRGDRVGGLVFDDSAHREIRPRSSRRSVLELVRALSAAPADLGAAPATVPWIGALERTARLAKPGTLLFVISDFYAPSAQAERYLAVLGRHSEIVLIWIYDPFESRPPPPGRYRVSNGESFLDLDTADPRDRRRYTESFRAREQYLGELSRRHHLRLIPIATDAAVATALRRGLQAPASGPATLSNEHG